MKKILFLAVLAFVMSSCSKKTIVYNSAPVVETKNDTWAVFTLKKRETQKRSDFEVQFAIQSAITLSNARDTEVVNMRGDIEDSVIYKEYSIKALEECKFSKEKVGSNWVIYWMEFSMKNGDIIQIPFTATGTAESTEFILKTDPSHPSYIKLGDGQFWKVSTSNQKLMYSKKSSGTNDIAKSIPNRVPGR